MNDSSPNPSDPKAPGPNPTTPTSDDSSAPSPEHDAVASEGVPIDGPAACVEALLREPGRVMAQLSGAGGRRIVVILLGIALVCSLIYGLIVGLFSGGEQIYYAPIKIALGLLLSSLICLPSLYIFAALGGSKAGLADVLGLLAGLLALSSIMLIGFAPVAWIFSESTESLAMMGALHFGFWFISVYFGLRFLNAGFRRTEMRSSEGVSVWMIIFVIVALQMTTTLRPLLGTAPSALPEEKRFFLAHWAEVLRVSPNWDKPRAEIEAANPDR
jgi:hypothetical protein